MRQKVVRLALAHPGIRLLIIRLTSQDAYDNHVRQLIEIFGDYAKWSRESRELIVKNGSVIKIGYCANQNDLLHYQGIQYDCIFLDEATQHPEDVFRKLDASCRGANNFPHRIYITCNPGGVGHAWVHRLFIRRDFRPDENPDDYTFIQATIFDNPVLMEKDPAYFRSLESLPPDVKRAWLYGDWDVFEGQFFTEFDRAKHVCAPFAIPDWWRRYVAIDYGMDMLAALWIAVDGAGNAVVYKELYEGRDYDGDDKYQRPGTNGHIIPDAAKRLLEVNGGDNVYLWLAPPDLWNRRQETGRSAADLFREYGVPMVKSPNNRVNGWRNVHDWLALRKNEFGEDAPRLRIFDCCKNLIRTLPMLRYDDKKPDDVATEPHELTHAPDALRGFCAWWAQSGEEPEKVPERIVFRDQTAEEEFAEFDRFGKEDDDWNWN